MIFHVFHVFLIFCKSPWVWIGVVVSVECCTLVKNGVSKSVIFVNFAKSPWVWIGVVTTTDTTGPIHARNLTNH